MSVMQTVFISSIQSGFEDVRAAARDGVESFGWRAVMAETVGATPASPQRGLLDRVAESDVVLLLIGPRYGASQESGLTARPRRNLTKRDGAGSRSSCCARRASSSPSSRSS